MKEIQELKKKTAEEIKERRQRREKSMSGHFDFKREMVKNKIVLSVISSFGFNFYFVHNLSLPYNNVYFTLKLFKVDTQLLRGYNKVNNILVFEKN